MIRQQRLSAEAWGRELDKMIGWGAAIDPGDRARLVASFSSRYGLATPPPPVAPADASRADALIETRCLSCHGRDMIEQQRLSADGWSRELDKMIGWGAALSPAERDTLARFLAARLSTQQN